MLTVLEVSLRNRGFLNLHDQNIFSQRFIAELLNIVFGYKLVNLDYQKKNYTAIDLGDWERKIAFQVTVTKSSSKIKDAITKFIRSQQYVYFENLKVFILAQKQKSYRSNFETEGKFNFDPKVDIIDIPDIIKRVPSLSPEQLQEINSLINHDFFGYSSSDDSKPLTRETNTQKENYQVLRTVYRTEVPLYSDPECQCIRSGVSGVILEIREQPGNILNGYTIHPTTRKHFKAGIQVAWEWNIHNRFDKLWYRDPETGEIRSAWTQSAEFVGRAINN